MPTLFPQTIQAHRRAGSYVGPRWVAADIDFTFEGSVQPVTGKEFETLAIGRQDGGILKVYSDSLLNVSKEGNPQTGDWFTWDGRQWELCAELPNQNSLIPHYKYIARERGEAQ